MALCDLIDDQKDRLAACLAEAVVCWAFRAGCRNPAIAKKLGALDKLFSAQDAIQRDIRQTLG